MLKTLLFITLILQGILMASQEPKYTVVEKFKLFEIREYEPYLVAQTEVEGNFEEMGGKAFRILVKYISGQNKQRSKISMTSPVIQETGDQAGQKISMTAPVIQDSITNDTKHAVFSFVMPRHFTMETLPLPLDERITLKEIPSKRVAVLEYSGGWGEEKYKEKETLLLNALKEAGITTIGQASFARYNSPFTLWFLRRNEVMLEVQR